MYHHRMLPNRSYFLLMLFVPVVVIVEFGESLTCIPNKFILLSNCSFRYHHTHSTIDNRTLSMTVPYALDSNEEHDLLITTISRHYPSSKPLIRFTLNTIMCENYSSIHWTSLESSSTLHGEFVRTNLMNNGTMYLSSGLTYLRNLTSLNCSTKTIYHTDEEQLFRLDFRIESTLNDQCQTDHDCFPIDNYQCNQERHRCICRSPLQSYLTNEQQLVCIHLVNRIDQCPTSKARCLEWCHQNSSSNSCLCPTSISTKKYLSSGQGYCEGRSGGTCDSIVRCPSGDLCIRGSCRNGNKFHQSMPFEIITISIIISCTILFLIIISLTLGVCLLRRRRWKKHYLPPINSIYTTKKQQMTLPTTSDYDNIVYGAFRNNIQHLSNDNNQDSPVTTSDDSPYHPKIVFLGGEQQLTAIFA